MTGYRRVIGIGSQSPRRLRRKWDDLRRQLDHLDGHAERVAWLRIRAIEKILAASKEQQTIRTRLNLQWLKSVAQRSALGIASPSKNWRVRMNAATAG